MNSALMGSGHFAGFSKNARIGKPGIFWGFRGLHSQIGVVPSECQDNDQENSYKKQKVALEISSLSLTPPGEEDGISHGRCLPPPKPYPLLRSVFVTLLNPTSSVPVVIH